jgi:UDP-glucuronate 4-epimerase
VDDIVESIARLIPKPLATKDGRSLSDSEGSQNSIEVPNLAPQNHDGAPFQVFNIGNSAPVELMQYIEALEKALGKTAKKNFMDIQAGDVPATHADVSKLEEYVNFRPQTTVEEGVQRFVDWYLESKKK